MTTFNLLSKQGKLNISRSNCRDLQLLIRMLGIDPDNVRVEAVEESTRKRMVQSQLTASMGLMTQHPVPVAKPEQQKPAKPNNTIRGVEPQGRPYTLVKLNRS